MAASTALTPQEWLDVFDRLSNDVRSLTATAREKDQMNALSSKEKRLLNKQLHDFQDQVLQLDKSLTSMEQNPVSFKIGDGELNRRRGLMTRLRDSIQATDDVLQGRTGARGQLLSGGGKRKEYNDTDATRDLSNRDLLQQQQQVLDRQDEHLDAILHGVTKLKVMSTDISGELDVHQTLLDDLGNAIDTTDSRIVQSTIKVQDIQEKEASCLPLCIILLLAAAIIVLLIVPS